LFVYGTFKRGGCRHPLLSGQRCLGEVRTAPVYALYHLGSYPGLVRQDDVGQTVHGEAYEVSCSLVGRLDADEGAPWLFDLELIDVAGLEAPVWAYFYKRDVAGQARIASGRWDVREG